MGIVFDVLVNEKFSTIDKNFLLSLVNDYESGYWRHTKFQDYIFNNIAQTALSATERKKLIDKPRSYLAEAAKNIRIGKTENTDSGSELCEILLYGIMKDHYQALSVVPKIFYKQNSQDYAKGADSVHIVIEGDDFSLWFGEAKFQKDINNAIRNAVNSLKLFFGNDEQIKKENAIITSVSDINQMNLSNELVEAIKSTLSGENSLDNIKPKIHVPILLLYECSITKENDYFSEEYKNKIISFHKNKANSYFKKQFEEISGIFKYQDINFHLILFPIPDKQKVVDKFCRQIESLRE